MPNVTDRSDKRDEHESRDFVKCIVFSPRRHYVLQGMYRVLQLLEELKVSQLVNEDAWKIMQTSGCVLREKRCGLDFSAKVR